MPEFPVEHIRCPGCDYSPIDEARYTGPLQNTMPTTREELLDCFEVVGCDDGHVMCPKCVMEFNPDTGESRTIDPDEDGIDVG